MEKVNTMREEYIGSLMQHFKDAIASLKIEKLDIDLKYVKGWDKTDSLMTAIENIGKDQIVGHARDGRPT